MGEQRSAPKPRFARLPRLVRIAGVALAAAILAGCPLTSDLPLSDPAAARVDPALVGAWRTKDLDTGEWRTLTFLPFDDHEMVGFTPGDVKDSVDAIRVFVTPVDDERFLNVTELGSSASGWYLVRYRIDVGMLVMSVVDDGLFAGRSFATSAELLAFVRRNLADPQLYTPTGEERQDMTWERVSN